ncbi:Hypothetical protein Minf_0904 [Methylacidiphilum infernorum V4]|uniref:Uncharacterized protein n=1 Tax=Methylacidiphilum infernorum (isolate V4) TaxID=481448 RepID=B3DUF6_METI4|nr:Hypothetical protein Minf_0904 [Methylacidiphilum infernorum V4]
MAGEMTFSFKVWPQETFDFFFLFISWGHSKTNSRQEHRRQGGIP